MMMVVVIYPAISYFLIMLNPCFIFLTQGVIIEKEECINHVGKRLGTALHNLLTDCSKRGTTLGGNGMVMGDSPKIRFASSKFTTHKPFVGITLHTR